MPMAILGVAKLIEECGELQQVLGKRLAYWTTDQHPDGTNLVQRLEQEMGDVIEQTGLSWQTIMARRDEKLRTYERWDREADNNVHSVERAAVRRMKPQPPALRRRQPE